MKKRILLVAAALIILSPGLSLAETSSIELGKQLFNDPTLGGSTNSKTCNSCHDNGSGLEKSGDNQNLVKMINKCIEGPLAGKAIDGRTAPMRSLKMYIQSLGNQPN
ncbi:MAG: cytochrome C [Proteobacteria bacterium]|nr:cytochrome C [Pseudomonadota bacterium]MBU1710976.1 cytochrome C [Pseudomonadota bacterium]